MRKAGLVLQAHEHGNAQAVGAPGLHLALVDRLADPQQGRFVHVEVGIHRVERDDCGQQRLVLVDQVAQGQVIAAHHAADRRDDIGEFVVEPVNLTIFLIRLDPRIGLLDRGLILVNLLPADGVGGHVVNRPVPRQGRPGQLELGLVEVDLPDRLIELGLVGSWINHEEQITRLDFRPLLERHLHQVARGSWADVH